MVGCLDAGCLESPATAKGARVIKSVKDPPNFSFVDIIRKIAKYIACGLFLPIFVGIKALKAVLKLRQHYLAKNTVMEGKVVLITGASSGLGEALAHVFYDEGCKLIIAGRQKSKLEAVREKLLSSKIRQGNVYPPVSEIQFSQLST